MGQQKSKVFQCQFLVGQCSSNSDTVQQMLKDEDIDCLINTDSYKEVTPLWLAVRFDDVKLVLTFLSYGAYVNKPCSSLQMTPLHVASFYHCKEIMRILLEAKADANVVDRWNYSPLMYAAIHCEPSIVNDLFRLLLAFGADVNFGAILNSEGVTGSYNKDLPEIQNICEAMYVQQPIGPVSGSVLHLVAQNPHLPVETLEILYSANANLDLRNLYGQTSLMVTMFDMYYNYHSNIQAHAEFLVNKGASVNAQDIRGWTALHYAAYAGNEMCIDLLLKADADSNILGSSRESPLWLLLTLGWKQAAYHLLCCGCNVNQPLKSVTILGINPGVNVCRYGNILPIEFAVCNKYYQLAMLLLRLGAAIENSTWLGVMDDDEFIGGTASYLTYSEKFFEYLSSVRINARDLKELCRNSVRKAMGKNIINKCEVLPIPRSLKEYISCAGGVDTERLQKNR